MPRLTRRAAAALVLAGIAIAGPVAAQDARQGIAADSVIETIKKRGRIVIGLSTFVPWAMTDKSGQLIGFEIDVAKQLAKDMGVEAEFVPTAWDGIIPALIAGKFDVIISGMSITPQRNLTVNFSEPYAYSGLRVAASTKIKDKVKSLEDLNSPDITFALRRGATPVPVVQKLFPKANLVQFDEDGASLQEVLNGNADATVASEPTPSTYVIDYPDKIYIPVEDLLDATAEAFALRKGDPDALNFFNNWIDAQWRSGFLDERHDYWFRTLDWQDQVAAQ
ncbi:MAG: transporter substrate-binding domain-containing protein [Geminicoccaceae bacterium]